MSNKIFKFKFPYWEKRVGKNTTELSTPDEPCENDNEYVYMSNEDIYEGLLSGDDRKILDFFKQLLPQMDYDGEGLMMKIKIVQMLLKDLLKEYPDDFSKTEELVIKTMLSVLDGQEYQQRYY